MIRDFRCSPATTNGPTGAVDDYRADLSAFFSSAHGPLNHLRRDPGGRRSSRSAGKAEKHVGCAKPAAEMLEFTLPRVHAAAV